MKAAKFAVPVPRVDYWRVAITRKLYIKHTRSAIDDMPILYYAPEAGAQAYRLPHNAIVTIEEASSLNNRLFWLNAPIIATLKQLYWILTSAGNTYKTN